MYIYLESEPGLYTVGHYAPDGKFISTEDYSKKSEAMDMVAYLNGKGNNENQQPDITDFYAGFAMQAIFHQSKVTSEVAFHAFNMAEDMVKERQRRKNKTK